MVPIKDWPEKVRAFRERHAITQAELAQKLGVSKRCVEQWEGGQRKPMFYLILALYWLDHRL